MPPPAPLFFSASVDEGVALGLREVTAELRLKLHVLQGRPDVLTIGLSGDGEVTDVSGAGLRDWSVRQAAGEPGGRRLLDLRPELAADGPGPSDLNFMVHVRVRQPAVPGTVVLLVATPGDAVGFTSILRLVPGPGVVVWVVSVSGLAPLSDPAHPGDPLSYVSSGEGRIEASLTPQGTAAADAELGRTPGFTGGSPNRAESVELPPARPAPGREGGCTPAGTLGARGPERLAFGRGLARRAGAGRRRIRLRPGGRPGGRVRGGPSLCGAGPQARRLAVP